jgi:RNA polymerase sigma-70 factor (ECF subfamily)
MADLDIKALLERARGGDRAAFETLYDRFEGSVYALCARLLADGEDAAEAASEVWLVVWRRLSSLRRAEAFTAWLRQTVVRTCRRHARRRPWWQPWPDADSGVEPADETRPPPGAQLEQAELSERVSEALNKLSPAHREVIVLHHLEGLGVVEIAAVLEVAPGTVKSRLGRAREHLARLLGPYVETGP